MTYSLNDSVFCNSNPTGVAGFVNLIDKLFLVWLPTKGFTCEVWNKSTNEKVLSPLVDNLSGSWTSSLWVFIKKTVTYRDDTTSDESWALDIQLNQSDIHHHVWDGVKATTDTSDPDYGVGTDRYAIPTYTPMSYEHHIEFWTESGSDAYFLRSVQVLDGLRQENTSQLMGYWLPDGGYCRHEQYTEDPDTLTKNRLPLVLLYAGVSPRIMTPKSSWGARNSSPVDYFNKQKLTNYVSIWDQYDAALWINKGDKDYYTSASKTSPTSNLEYMKSVKIGSNYYIDLEQPDDTYGWLLLPVGPTYPGF